MTHSRGQRKWNCLKMTSFRSNVIDNGNIYQVVDRHLIDIISTYNRRKILTEIDRDEMLRPI